MTRTVRTLFVTLLVCVPAASLSSWAGIGDAEHCRTRLVPGIGPACRNAGGSLDVYSPDGRLLGVTHDPVDAAPAASGSSRAPAAVTPACAPSTAGDKHFVAVYARAGDDADAYSTLGGKIRTLIAGVNGYIRQASAASGDIADAKFLCSSGAVVVKHEVLPTKRASTTFSTIVADLQAKGYTDPKLKFAVFFDDTGVCSCVGQGMFVEDENAAASNGNNGNASYPLFAVDYGRLDAHIMAHEVMHTLGAVGANAPHTTGAHHCTDGLDLMCYNDGGTKGLLYSGSVCSADVLDCKKDDYFNARPPAGSYLASHWNIASRLNAYFAFPPLMTELTCPASAGLRKLTYCAFSATDVSRGIYYTVVWGDGTVARVPATGTVVPGKRQVATHTYGKVGSFLIRVSATGSRASAPLARWMRIVSDITPPVLSVADPTPGTLYNGCATKQSGTGTGDAVFVQRGCVRASAGDPGSGMHHVSVYMGRSHMGTLYRAPWVFDFGVGLPGADIPIRVEAWDNAGNMSSKTVIVIVS